MMVLGTYWVSEWSIAYWMIRDSKLFAMIFSYGKAWGAALHRGSVRASHPAAPGLNLGAPDFLSIEISSVASRKCRLGKWTATEPKKTRKSSRRKKTVSVWAGIHFKVCFTIKFGFTIIFWVENDLINFVQQPMFPILVKMSSSEVAEINHKTSCFTKAPSFRLTQNKEIHTLYIF